MTDDRESRALAAGDLIEVNGKEYRLRPVRVQNLCDLENDALQYYKRQCLQTYKENLDLLDVEDQKHFMREKLDEVARWGVQDLPHKSAFDVSLVPVNDKLKKWISDEYGISPERDTGYLALLSNALDNGNITPEEIQKVSGRKPISGRVRYDQWWMTANYSGMVCLIYNSVRSDDDKVTKDEIKSWPFPKIAEAATIVERLTAANMGNG